MKQVIHTPYRLTINNASAETLIAEFEKVKKNKQSIAICEFEEFDFSGYEEKIVPSLLYFSGLDILNCAFSQKFVRTLRDELTKNRHHFMHIKCTPSHALSDDAAKDLAVIAGMSPLVTIRMSGESEDAAKKQKEKLFLDEFFALPKNQSIHIFWQGSTSPADIKEALSDRRHHFRNKLEEGEFSFLALKAMREAVAFPDFPNSHQQKEKREGRLISDMSKALTPLLGTPQVTYDEFSHTELAKEKLGLWYHYDLKTIVQKNKDKKEKECRSILSKEIDDKLSSVNALNAFERGDESYEGFCFKNYQGERNIQKYKDRLKEQLSGRQGEELKKWYVALEQTIRLKDPVRFLQDVIQNGFPIEEDVELAAEQLQQWVIFLQQYKQDIIYYYDEKNYSSSQRESFIAGIEQQISFYGDILKQAETESPSLCGLEKVMASPHQAPQRERED